MKIQRLYVKILLSCLGILAVTIVMIIVLFMFTAGRTYTDYLDQQTFSKLKIFQDMVQETIDLHPDRPVTRNPDLLKALNTFSALFDIKIWVTEPGGTILLKTFEGAAGMPRSGVHRQVHHANGITLYHYFLRWMKYYATIPINAGENGLHLHLYIDTRDPNHPEGLFFIGILAIGGIAALLVIPMASFITRRINRLNQSALEFANGNLSVRTDIKGHDEIANLGDSFNLMADKLEKLVHNAKELTANVSHELRSPLARIRVSKTLILDKLDQGAGKAGIQRYFDNMESDIQDLDTLVEHMLTLSKMNYQESALSYEPFSFRQFLEHELLQYRDLLRQKDLGLELEVKGTVLIRQDRAVVKSIFSNLMDNAVKYTAPGETISLSASSQRERALDFCITNPCPPLSDTDLERLFDPFFRLAGQNAPGSGLGLTIAKKLVSRCQGRISAKSTPLGLTMEVHLP